MTPKKPAKKGAAPAASWPGNIHIEFGDTSEQAAANYARTAQGQRDYTYELAKKIEAGENLDQIEKIWAAGLLRCWADNLPQTMPKGRGKPRKVDPGHLAIEFALKVKGGMSENAAIEKLADEHDMSVPGIKKSLKKYKSDALALLSIKTKPRN
jgi:hypothetical protein